MRTITRVASARRPRSDKPISHCYETVAKQLCCVPREYEFPVKMQMSPFSLSSLSASNN